MTTNSLPRPVILWSGASKRGIVNTDCQTDARLVLKYVLSKKSEKDKEFTPEPKAVYETIAGHDAMGTAIWKEESMASLPVEFFVEIFAKSNK